jgi:hypothetical protein
MIINFKSEGLPVGTYAAEFVRGESYTNEERSDLPPAVKLVWRVLAGKYEGSEGTRICSLKYGSKAALPKFLRSVMGRDPEPGEAIDLTQFAGVNGTIVVEETDSGGTRVSAFLRTETPAEETGEQEPAISF